MGRDGWWWFGGATAAIVVDAARELRYSSIGADSGEMRRYDDASLKYGAHPVAVPHPRLTAARWIGIVLFGPNDEKERLWIQLEIIVINLVGRGAIAQKTSRCGRERERSWQFVAWTGGITLFMRRGEVNKNQKWARRVVLNISADQMTGQNPFLSRTFVERPAVLGFVRQNRILTCRTESVPGHRF